MAGETPGGRTVQAGSGEGIEAQGLGVGVDVVSHGLQGSKVLDLVDGVASLLQQVHVGDDAEGLIAVAHGLQSTLIVVQVKVVGGQLTGHGGAGQVQSVLVPVAQGFPVADDEQGGRLGLGHLSGQGLLIGAGSGGDNLHGDTGLGGVQRGDLLQRGVCFGLEVQVVDGAGLLSGSHGAQAQNHHNSQEQCKKLLHMVYPPKIF